MNVIPKLHIACMYSSLKIRHQIAFRLFFHLASTIYRVHYCIFALISYARLPLTCVTSAMAYHH